MAKNDTVMRILFSLSGLLFCLFFISIISEIYDIFTFIQTSNVQQFLLIFLTAIFFSGGVLLAELRQLRELETV